MKARFLCAILLLAGSLIALCTTATTSGTKGHPTDFRQLQYLAANQDAVVLEYTLGEPHSRLHIVTPQTEAFMTLPSGRVIEECVHRYRDLIIASKSSNNADHLLLGSKLYTMLMSPAERFLSKRNLVIIPDDRLFGLTFESLSRGRAQGHLVVDDFTVMYAPSLGIGKIPNRQKPVRTASKILVYADPVFADARLPRLPFSRVEAMRINELFQSTATLRLGFEATNYSAKRELQSARIVHFATHGIIDEKTNQEALTLTPRDGIAEDGLLRADEVSVLNLSAAELVVLSGCNTNSRGDGLQQHGVAGGLTEAFLAAGAKTVVSSLWVIDDAAGSDFMGLFYQQISRGLTPAEALRRAKLTMRASSRYAYNHPYFWAPFVITESP